MAQRPTLTALYAAAAVAIVAIAAGIFSMLPGSAGAPPTGLPPTGMPPTGLPPTGLPQAKAVAQEPVTALPARPADAPLTTTSPAAASNGHLTIRLIGGQPER